MVEPRLEPRDTPGFRRTCGVWIESADNRDRDLWESWWVVRDRGLDQRH